ncbi:hypothetical protein HPB52_013665 [Rhipicephalus sanguineus]|uniref:CUB domain-containing protein n=1 Tax=Rhipicephalus sanguineus TaxID=34632 RepID=A0A9D4SQT9_RHISA|nr:hypothetical protein HPB52_013665 [Rhipicephalus sanguineus]
MRGSVRFSTTTTVMVGEDVEHHIDGTAETAGTPPRMTLRMLLVFLAVMTTVVSGDLQRSDEKTNHAAIGSVSSMAQSLGQNFPVPSFLVQTADRVTPQPLQCVAPSGQEGLCIFAKQCLKDGGASLGRCNDGETICCHPANVYIFAQRKHEDRAGAGQAHHLRRHGVRRRGSVRSPDTPQQDAMFRQCQVTVQAREGVCQLRLDFSEFSLSPPETCGPRAGMCLDDAFSVSAGLESSNYPVLCGYNSGQHMYVDVSQTKQAILTVRLSARTERERRWSIRITQVSCWSPTMAPEGCLQYHTKASDVITSFNFVRNPTGFHYYANMHYSICIRRQLGFCSILYEENGTNGFRLSPLVNQRCRDAYVLIPTGSTGAVSDGNLGDRICGTTFTPVAANLAPFRVSFVTGPRIGYSDCPCPGVRPNGRPNTPVRPDPPAVVRPNPPPQVLPTQQPPRPVEPIRPAPNQPAQPAPVVLPPVPETPIGSQQPGGLGSAAANFTQFATGRQFADALVCRAGGFSLRYTQLPHGC